MTMRFVKTTSELKRALNDKVDTIVITDYKLGKTVQVIKAVKYAGLAIIAGGGAIAAASSWNPAGWLSGGVAGAAGVAVFASAASTVGAVGISGGVAALGVAAIVAVATLGTAALVMHKDYKLCIDTNAGGRFKGTENMKGNASFSMTLQRNNG